MRTKSTTRIGRESRTMSQLSGFGKPSAVKHRRSPRRTQPLLFAAGLCGLGVLVVLAWNGAFSTLFSANYLPHRFCYLAQPGLIWTSVLTDAMIAAAYAMIFGSLLWLAARLRLVHGLREYLWIFVSFALFIAACGATHAMGIITIWWPIYPMAALINGLCAAISLPTAILFSRTAPTVEKNLKQYRTMCVAVESARDDAIRALEKSEKLVAEQDRQARELAAANARLDGFRVMIEAVVDYALFMINPNGIVISWNVGAERIKGYRVEEIVGQHFSIFYTAEAIESGLPDRELSLAVRDGRYEQEGWRVRKNDARFWSRVTITALRDPEGKLIGFGNVTRDLTERRRSDDALLASDQRKTQVATELAAANSYIRNLFNAPTFISIISTDLHGTINVFNRGAEIMLGYAAEEVLGKHTPELFHLQIEIETRALQLSRLLDRHVKGFDVFINSMGRPEFEHLEWTYVRKDGSHINVALALTVVQDEGGNPRGYLGIAEDITERLRATKAIAGAYAQLNSVLECTSDSVMTIGEDWRLLYGNRHTMENLPDFEVGKSYWECFPGVVGTPSEQVLRNAMKNHIEDSYEIFYETYELWFKVRLYPSNSGLSAFFSDITEEKKMHRQLELEQTLREKRIEGLSHMAGGLAHEISNPLAIIHARASDLTALAGTHEMLSADEVRKASQSIVQTSDRAIRILRGLRGFAREAGNDPMEWGSVDHMIEQCLELQGTRFERHVIDLRIHVEPNVPLVLCREIQIGQILTNLLNNAFDAIQQSSSTERWVAIDVSHQPEKISIDVTDSGPGIEDKFRPYLMDPFFTTKSHGLGMGVGLSLSRAIAQDHGGTLTLLPDSKHTCFRLSLPIDITSHTERA